MDTKWVLLILVCIAIGFYLKLEMVSLLLILFLFFIALGSTSGGKNKTPTSASEEVIYPVIYEDVGEPPYLYPPGMKINLKPDWEPWPQWHYGATGLGNLARSITNLLRGGKK